MNNILTGYGAKVGCEYVGNKKICYIEVKPHRDLKKNEVVRIALPIYLIKNLIKKESLWTNKNSKNK